MVVLVTGPSCSRKSEGVRSGTEDRGPNTNPLRVTIPAEPSRSGPKIDLVHATLNERPLSELTLDAVTDLFGRPTASADPTADLGPILAYADQGLVFWFKDRLEDPRQRLISIVVYLTPKQDSETHVQCLAFRGTFVQGITAEWKAPMVMQAFAKFNPEDAYDPLLAEQARIFEFERKTVAAMGVDRSRTELTAKDLTSGLARISVKFPFSDASFHYDENTKFLEYIEVSPDREAKADRPATD